jgi:hypothetical protein
MMFGASRWLDVTARRYRDRRRRDRRYGDREPALPGT